MPGLRVGERCVCGNVNLTLFPNLALTCHPGHVTLIKDTGDLEMYQNKPGNIWFVLILFSCGLQSQPAFAALPKNARIDGGITMNTITIDSKNVQMIAHRGVSGIEMENTAAAFVAAGNRSYFGIETDVHVTADGKFVVIHDEQTGRVAEDDINVEQCSYNLIRKVKLHNISNEERNNGLTTEDVAHRSDLIIPNLEEDGSICKKYGKYFNDVLK